ncbi:hypothetical protein [Hymenobacter properus]|uniref:Uncharacterized protein n=1 Tax=Hymenobacter properus TaxID=2791026 RepID=A0A931BCL0_9BACT|nr:hypothetical protein [Hymenobacter properus]MBF9140809.1 hypothetical protein [Hymenobacter properus]MBR7719618.1 hypothetical protein [Microvirga sp. SRT04]
MSTPAAKPLTVPPLPDAVARHLSHDVTALRGGDQLHLRTAILGYAKGAVLPIYGYCCLRDEHGTPFCVTAYVRPNGAAGQPVVAYSERDAVRFRFEDQTECWFGAVLMYLVPVDLTDYADCLRLERQPATMARLLLNETETPYRQAA